MKYRAYSGQVHMINTLEGEDVPVKRISVLSEAVWWRTCSTSGSPSAPPALSAPSGR